MYEVEDVNRRKAFAVGILSRVWSGSELPEAMVLEAKRIRAEMVADGTWASA